MRCLQCLWLRPRIPRLITALIFCNLISILLIHMSESNLQVRRADKKQVANLRSIADNLNWAHTMDALQYVRALNTNLSQRFYMENYARPSLDLVVSIPTVHRPTKSDHRGEGYLMQTASRFDRLLKTDQHFGGKMMFICNTDEKPNVNAEAITMQDHFPFVQLYGYARSKIVPAVKNMSFYRKSNKDKYTKEAFDYTFCLQTALLYKPKYIIMAQDDALPRAELLPTLDQLLRNQQGRLSSGDTIERKPLFLMKLYYPVPWLGFAYEAPRIIELFGIAAFVWGLFAILFFFYLNWSYYETLIVATLGCVFLLLLAMLIGRQNLLELRRLSSQLYSIRTSPECCIPAVLYRTEYVSKLIRYLSQGSYSSERPIDIAIGQYSKIIHESSIYVEPNLFRHIGMYSSLDKVPKDPEYYLFQRT